jgi:hypothetical protein
MDLASEINQISNVALLQLYLLSGVTGNLKIEKVWTSCDFESYSGHHE